MGQITGSIGGGVGGGWNTRIDWVSNQDAGDIFNNRSRVKAYYYLVLGTYNSLYNSAGYPTYLSVNGNYNEWTTGGISSGGNQTIYLGESPEYYVYHNSDGTKQINISANYPIKATLSGTYYSNIYSSGTVTLSSINREAPSLTVNSITPETNSVTLDMSISHPYGITNTAYSLNGGDYVTTTEDFTVSNLSSGQSYTIRIRATAGNGVTGYTSVLSFETKGAITRVKVLTTFKKGITWIKVGAVWKKGKKAYIKVGASWKESK